MFPPAPLLVLLAGCSPEPADTAGAPFADWAPATSGDPTPLPAWSPADAASALEAGLAAGFVRPADIQGAYLRRMALGDARCPGDPLQIMSDRVALEGCAATTGAVFSGITTYILPPEGGFVLAGDFRIAPRDGTAMEGGGAVVLRIDDSDTEIRRMAEVGGTWRAQGEPGLLGEGVSAQLRVEVARSRDRGHLALEGSWGAGERALYFEGAGIDDACGRGLSGRASVRDPNGGWWVWTSESCDGCGELSYERQAATSACVSAPGLDEALTAMVTP